MPLISKSFIDDLPNQIDIVNLIGKRLSLKKTGNDYRAPCPFHGGKNLNFSVNTQKQFYHCFKCGESGGAIRFVEKYDNLDFVGAIETIANEFGLKIEYDSRIKPIDPNIARYRVLSKKVSDFFQQQLKVSLANKKAISYTKKRGISREIALRFSIGFATPSNKDLINYFGSAKQDLIDLKTLGLIKTGKYGDYDFFRDRLMFPIHNSKGNVIAFGGRAFDDKIKAKYLNSQESPIFFKSRELYGLYHARKYSNAINSILVVEGYMDVIALHQAGITKVVATLGTATTPEHLTILSQTAKVIVFCFDGDNAGRAAAWKALKITLPIVKPGLIIKFLFLPEGEDPDSLVKKESAVAFEGRIEKAQMLSKFLFEHIKLAVDFDTIEGKSLFLEKTLALIAQVTYNTYQQQLIQGVGQIVGQSVEQIKMIFDKQIKQVQMQSTLMTKRTDPATNFSKNIESFIPPQQSKTTKASMSKMINLLLNFPSLADNAIIGRIKNIEKSQILLELVQSAELDENISQEVLIKPFKSKLGIYQRLQALCILEPHLSENQAKDEFQSALDTIERQQKNAQIKRSISNANTEEAQRKVMKDIIKSKIKK